MRALINVITIWHIFCIFHCTNSCQTPTFIHQKLYTMKRTHIISPVKYAFLALMLLAFAACETTDRTGKPSASGRAGELLAVMETRLWEGQVGAAFEDVFRKPVSTLNQPEPMFNVIFIPEREFSRVFETHRHIFMINIDETLTDPRIEFNRDVWSYPQMVVRVTAPSQESAVRIIQNNDQQFYDRFLSVEYLRLEDAYRRMLQTSSHQTVKNMFGVDMAIPEGYFVATEGEDFVWLRKSATNEEFDQAVMIWTLDYTDPAVDFDEDVIWARRDSITQRYIPGQFPGTYMTTYNTRPLKLRPEFREIDFNGMYAIEARSLWRVEGDFMGGPFVTYTFVDEETNRLFMMDGWVFAPKYDKRDFLRQVEGIIWSARFPEPEEEEEV